MHIPSDSHTLASVYIYSAILYTSALSGVHLKRALHASWYRTAAWRERGVRFFDMQMKRSTPVLCIRLHNNVTARASDQRGDDIQTPIYACVSMSTRDVRINPRVVAAAAAVRAYNTNICINCRARERLYKLNFTTSPAHARIRGLPHPLDCV